MGTHSQVGCHGVSQRDEFFAEHGYLQTPGLVQWMATLRCGLSCEHCLAVSHESGFGDMPIEAVRGLVDEIAAMGVREFLVTGGEPLAREDLGEVIEYLGRRGVNWSLNTAAMPDASVREAMARHKPGLVAVSVDGPREVHDAFRGKAGAYDEAIEAIRFYKSLGGVRVCAGTTMTSRNYDCLDETFHLVAASGADQWGIHLLVPEGRAADRPDLFLAKAQIKRLVKFVARKRRYFHVEMADEIGYLGYLEPLVRDVPLVCGAGRTQCVVLPDGHIVPCTTLDRLCSAGNIHERPLAQIWAEGFSSLRSWRPGDKCGHCDYSLACRGGCWLQRKSGTQCFKEVWHVPGALKTAAGIAICLGGLAAPAGSLAAPMAQPTSERRVAAAAATTIDQTILGLYVGKVKGEAMALPAGVDWSDPGWKFVKDFHEGTLPQDISGRCVAARNALETQERSLSLIALSWRAVNEPLFDPNNTGAYSQAERQAIRDALAAMEQKAQQWRLEIFEQNLDPYLSNGRQTNPSHCMVTKAGGMSCVYEETYFMTRDLNAERWGWRVDPETREAAEAYMLGRHYAEPMDLTFSILDAGQITRYSGGCSEVLSSRTASTYTIGVFDVVQAAGAVKLKFYLGGDIRTDSVSMVGQEMLLDDEGPAGLKLSQTLMVTLEAGREYTYAELLKAIYRQQTTTLYAMAWDWLLGDGVHTWNRFMYAYAAPGQGGPLLWPAFRDVLDGDYITLMPDNCGSREILGPEDVPPHLRGIDKLVTMKDADFWMF